MKLNELISRNLKSLEASSKMNESKFAEKCKIHQRTYNRIVNMETTASLEILMKIAEANDLEIWQLLLPNLDVTNPPLLAKDTEKQKMFYDKIKEVMKEMQ